MKAIGLMSGTSMDAIDVALIETDGETIGTFGPTVTYPYAAGAFGPAAAFPYTAQERQLLREAMQSARGLASRDDRSAVLGLAEEMITEKHAASVREFAAAYALDLTQIEVVGFHGQTVLHRPEKGFTVQLGDGQALSDSLGVPVVYDFRAADLEKGGQGAPLAPIFHRALALRNGLPLPAAFVNIGGVANVTFVPDGPAEGMVAFDAGPGNCLLDDWTMRHMGQPLDKDARLALSGRVNARVLKALISHPYFMAKPPKSLDRGAFSLDALEGLSAADGAATLTAFTVAGVAIAANWLPAMPKIWIVTGGGAHNPHMVEGLQRVVLPPLMTGQKLGLNVDFMEAQAFAYMAARRLLGLPSSFPGTTGAREPVVAGVLVEPNRQPESRVA